MSNLSKLTKLWLASNRLCFYCGRETYLPGYLGETRKEAQERLGLGPGKAALRKRRASIEHLKPRAEGGTREYHNIVLACVDCNSRRGSNAVSSWARLRGRAMERSEDERHGDSDGPDAR